MENSRRKFLKLSGLAGAAGLLPLGNILAESKINNQTSSDDCVLIPTETAGPFPLDLTANTSFFRQDIRESKDGVQLNLKLRIIGKDNCAPMSNVRVNIWHCDKDGLYSGYSQTNNAGQAGLTYLRGYQMTDANGEVDFTTIFPGWYQGRICHIHFQVYISSSYAAISQLTFDLETKNAIYTSNSNLYTKGADPLTYSTDNIFSDGYSYQLATLTQNSSGAYDSFLEVTVQGTGTVGIGHQEKENSKHFVLGQNFPNPFSNNTTIPVKLINGGDLKIEIYNLMGKKVHTIEKNGLSSGSYEILINLNEIGLSSANYLYQIELKVGDNIYRQGKLMTSAK